MGAVGVDALEAVRAEEIALRLDEIGGAARLPEGIEIAERRRQRRNRQARGTANLVQAQRDFFGAHGFERIDADGAHHGPWAGKV